MRVLLFVLAVVSFSANASVLGDLARVLQPGHWVKMPPNSSFDAAAATVDNSFGQLISYTDSAVWDPNKKQVRWVGSTGSCCADKPNRLLIYDLATDTWSIKIPPGLSGVHGYDGNAFDPGTSTHFFGAAGNTGIYTIDGNNDPGPEMAVAIGQADSLTWFPDINNGNGGLLQTGYRFQWYDGSQWNNIGKDAPYDFEQLDTISQYNPVLKEVLYGGGTYTPRAVLKLDKNLQRHVQDSNRVPSGLELSSRRALVSVDPVSGKYIINDKFQSGVGKWYEYDSQADSWQDITSSMVGAPVKTDSYTAFQVPIPDHGVIMVVMGQPREAYLYKHSPSEPNPAPQAPSNLTVE